MLAGSAFVGWTLWRDGQRVPAGSIRLAEQSPVSLAGSASAVAPQTNGIPVKSAAVARPPEVPAHAAARSAAPPVKNPGVVAALPAVIGAGDPVPVEALPETPADAAPAPPAPPVPRQPDASPRVEETAIRDVLARYAAAYSNLDAAAAQGVWPAVNRSSLARAFDGLASQHVSLEDCHVDVSGSFASAACTGTTTWTPKVGGGEARTDDLTWTFRLSKTTADWYIVSARVTPR
jgi:hypothetical protein